MNLIQFILTVFFLVAIIKALIRFRSRETTFGLAIIWVLFWSAAIGVVLYPNSTAQLARLAGIGRGADLVIYLSLTVIFYLIWRFLVKIEKLDRQITILTRRLALLDHKKENGL